MRIMIRKRLAVYLSVIMVLGLLANTPGFLSHVGAQTVAPSAAYTATDITPGQNLQVALVSIWRGQQVGNFSSHAAMWSGTPDSMVDLNPSFTTWSSAEGICEGQQVGNGGPFIPLNTFGTQSHALVWSGTAASAVDLNPNGWGSEATACSGNQQVGFGGTLGTTSKGTRINPGPTQAMLWSGSASSFVNLNPQGYYSSLAYGVSGGRQVGEADPIDPVTGLDIGSHAVVWSGTAASIVDLNPPGFAGSVARAISGLQAVGQGAGPATGGAAHALLWDVGTGGYVDLHPANGPYSLTVAYGTNGTQQVGYGFVPDPSGPFNGVFNQNGYVHALLWTGTPDSVVDLNQFLPPGFTDAYAYGIDSQGTISGSAMGPATISLLTSMPMAHGFLWTPSVSASMPSLVSITLDQSTVQAGGQATATVTLNQAAPVGGTLVSLLSSDPAGVIIDHSVTVPEGQITATALVNISATALTPSVSIFAAAGDTTRVASLSVNPALAVSVLKLAQNSLTGGSSVQATLTLNQAAPAGGALIALSSSAPAVASVPSSLLIPAGSNTGSFTISTTPVSASVNVKITAATANGLSQSAALSVNTDAVAVTKAEYVVSQKQLSVQATSTSLTATMKVYVSSTGALIGQMTNVGGGKYQIQLIWPVNPQNVTVRSNFGGSASLNITAK